MLHDGAGRGDQNPAGALAVGGGKRHMFDTRGRHLNLMGDGGVLGWNINLAQNVTPARIPLVAPFAARG